MKRFMTICLEDIKMPIDVNKIAPNPSLAALTGLMQGISEMKKKEEEKQQLALKNMIEQAKLRSTENYRQGMLDIAQQRVDVSSRELDQRIEHDKQMVDISLKQLQNSIESNDIDLQRLKFEMRKAMPAYQRVINKLNLDNEKDKIVLKNLLDLQAEQKKLNIDFKYKTGIDPAISGVPVGGLMGIEEKARLSREKIAEAGRERRSIRESETALRTAGLRAETAVNIAEAQILSREGEGALDRDLKRELDKDKDGNIKADIGNYNKLYDSFEKLYADRLDIAGTEQYEGDLNKLPEADKEFLSAKNAALWEMYAKIKQKNPEAQIPEPAISIDFIPKVAKTSWWSKTIPSQIQVTSTEELKQYQSIMRQAENIKKYSSKESARMALKQSGYTNNKAIERALGELYNE
jgi:hypothetical protein